METAAIEGASKLVDYGILGIVVLVCFSVIVWLARQQKDSLKMIVEDKDKQIESWKESTEKRDHQMDGVLAQLTENSKMQINNSKILIDLYKSQQLAISEIPERTVEKLQLATK